ncbi:Protein LURP-one-related 12 [Linum perenne]
MKESRSGGLVVGGGLFVYDEEKHFTIFKTSMFFANDGFTVHDSSNGELVFRVDSYGPDASERDELVLMDAQGRCLLTVRKKRRSMHQRWEGYTGDREEGQKAVFSVRRSSMIGRPGVCVELYENSSRREEEYEIEGSYGSRSCTVMDSSRKVAVAVISRKVDASTNVVLGKDAFSLALKPGFDAAFTMGIVLVLDHICGGNIVVVDQEFFEQQQQQGDEIEGWGGAGAGAGSGTGSSPSLSA